MSDRYQQADTTTTPMNRLGNVVKSLDFRSWVILILMFLVLTAMMGLNAYAWTTFLPPWVAYILSGFMEAGALGWKVADERKENSDAQQQLATILVWANVIMGILLLVLNLVRSAVGHAEVGEVITLSTWDWIAFILVALSALSHVAGALLFRQWDSRLQQRRQIEKLHNKASFDRDLNEGILGDLETRLELVNQVQERIAELEVQYAHLPKYEREAIIRDAKNALEERYGIDADDDGVVGEPIVTSPHSLEPALASDTMLSPELRKAIADEIAAQGENATEDSFR